MVDNVKVGDADENFEIIQAKRHRSSSTCTIEGIESFILHDSKINSYRNITMFKVFISYIIYMITFYM